MPDPAIHNGTNPDVRAQERPFEYGLIIDGREIGSANGSTFESCDPATGLPFATIAQAAPDDAERAVAAARRAFDDVWRFTSAADRGRLLQRASARLLTMAPEIAALEARDSGKVLTSATVFQ